MNFPDLVHSRLEDMAEQFQFLLESGDFEAAELIKAEGTALAEAADDGELFFFAPDLI
jgi:hypothetical protein